MQWPAHCLCSSAHGGRASAGTWLAEARADGLLNEQHREALIPRGCRAGRLSDNPRPVIWVHPCCHRVSDSVRMHGAL